MCPPFLYIQRYLGKQQCLGKNNWDWSHLNSVIKGKIINLFKTPANSTGFIVNASDGLTLTSYFIKETGIGGQNDIGLK